jgi:hypothetical protein
MGQPQPWVVLTRVDLVVSGAEPIAVQVATWVFAGLFSLNTLGNIAARSMVERYVMMPYTVLLVICFIVAALSQRRA